MNNQKLLLGYLRRIEPGFSDCTDEEIIQNLLRGQILDLETENASLRECNRLLEQTCTELEKVVKANLSADNIKNELLALTMSPELSAKEGSDIRRRVAKVNLKVNPNNFPETAKQFAKLLFLLLQN